MPPERTRKDIGRGIFLGLLGGLIVSTLGAWKDTLYEPFEPTKFIRSPIIGMVTGGIIAGVYPKLPAPVLLGSSVAFERLTVETWKAVIRKPPGKFSSENRDTGWFWQRVNTQEEKSLSKY